ncbi:hypothetical protein WJX72_003486 [[Myrmecia] bisecta]|uniref:TBC1 domain family member 31 n=1 Tax=[Myrmecia] bisecta TaxID=41462 RepID=A0AAW1Q6X4_9CHLO
MVGPISSPYEVTVTGSGRIWSSKPSSGSDGLVSIFKQPDASSKNSISRRAFTAVDVSPAADLLAAVDNRGSVTIFYVTRNRYALLDTAGCAGVTLKFSARSRKELYVALADNTVRCYNVNQMAQIGTLKGHRTPVHHIAVRGSGDELISVSADCILLWDLKTLQRKKALGSSPYGAVQALYTPDERTIITAFKDDSFCDSVVRFVDVEACELCYEIPAKAGGHNYEQMSMDARGNYLALASSDGQLLLFDLAAVRSAGSAAGPPHRLRRTERSALQQGMPVTPPPLPASEEADWPSDGAVAARPVPEKLSLPYKGPLRDLLQVPKAGSHEQWTTGVGADAKKQAAAAKQVWSSGRDAYRVVPLDDEAALLNKARLQELLWSYGEYPAKYRLVIWEFLLKIPHNSGAFQALANQGPHTAFDHLERHYPLQDRTLLNRLARMLSALAHWAPIFGEVAFLPAFVFPFVKLFGADEETCFEVLATVLMNLAHGWFDRFPNPPIACLGKLGEILANMDPSLFQGLGTGGVETYGWTLMSSLMTEVLSKSEWLKVADHLLTLDASFLLFMVAAYMVYFSDAVMAARSDDELNLLFRRNNALDVNKLVRLAYKLRELTPDAIKPPVKDLQALPAGHTYPIFRAFPVAAVKLQVQERERIQAEEEALLKRRQVVAQLEMRGNALAQQEKALGQEEQRLAALEIQRRAALREHEQQLQIERARLDDRAKEERLRQISVVEGAYQGQLAALRAEWSAQLEELRREVDHKKLMAAQELKARSEEESLKALEFQAAQRTWALQDTATRSAAAARLKQETAARQAKAEAARQFKLAGWAAEEEARKVQLQQAQARRAALAATEAEALAQAEAADLVARKDLEEEAMLFELERDRRLRLGAEDEAAVTAEALDLERRRTAARLAEDAALVATKAEADKAWYDTEALRRQEALAAAQEVRAAEVEERKAKFADIERTARLREKEAQLLERRRQLERQNLVEERATRKVLEKLALERERDAEIEFELALREEEVTARLEHAARVGDAQRAVEGEERTKMERMREELANHMAEREGELRRRHEETMARLALAREQQILELDTAWRKRVQKEEIQALAKETTTFNTAQESRAEQLAAKERAAAKEVARLAKEAHRMAEAAEAAPELQEAAGDSTDEEVSFALSTAVTTPLTTPGATPVKAAAQAAPDAAANQATTSQPPSPNADQRLRRLRSERLRAEGLEAAMLADPVASQPAVHAAGFESGSDLHSAASGLMSQSLASSMEQAGGRPAAKSSYASPIGSRGPSRHPSFGGGKPRRQTSDEAIDAFLKGGKSPEAASPRSPAAGPGSRRSDSPPGDSPDRRSASLSPISSLEGGSWGSHPAHSRDLSPPSRLSGSPRALSPQGSGLSFGSALSPQGASGRATFSPNLSPQRSLESDFGASPKGLRAGQRRLGSSDIGSPLSSPGSSL